MQNESSPISYSRYQPEAAAGRQELSRAARRGAIERIIRGAYMGADEWSELDLRGRYLARIEAVVATRRFPPVLSHFSAAAIHGLSVLDPWPAAVHITVLPSLSAHSRPTLTKHIALIPAEDLVSVGGYLVTSVARTVVDLAASSRFMAGVVTADAALFSDDRHGHQAATTKVDLRAALERALPLRAHARAADVVEFAETGAQTPIESVSRANMRVLHAPKPLLQVPHYDAEGFIGVTDFSWTEFGAVAEADGDNKYLDLAARSGRTPQQVLLDEKHREDRLRALPRRMARWPWAVALDPVRLRGKLLQIGLPLNVPWVSAVL